MYLNNFKEWKAIFEQASTGKAVTVESLKSIKADSKVIKESMYKILKAPGYTSTTQRDLDTLFRVFPKIGEALIKRYGIKNLFDYYKKAGVHQINLSKLPTDGKGPTPKWLYIFKDKVIYLMQDGSDLTINTKDSDSFLDWYNGIILKQWSENKGTYQLSWIAENQWMSHGIKVVTGVKTGGKGKSATRNGAKPVSLYTLKIGGKEVEYATYIILKNKSILDYQGGLELYSMISKEFRLDQDISKARSPKKAFIPYMILGRQSGPTEKAGILKSLHVDANPKIKSKESTLVPKTSDERKEINYVKADPKTWKIPGGFNVGKFKVEDSSEAQEFINNIVNEIKSYSSGKEKVKVGDIVITSSASNYYGGKVDPTHTNDGKVISKPKQGDPDPSVDSYEDLKGADANNKLAYLRGKNFAKALKDELLKLENIDLDGKITFNWRITDTGGKNDNVKDSDKYKNPGQYVKVSMRAVGSKKEVKSYKVTKPGSSGVVKMVKLRSLSVTFNPAPGVLKMHPNQKFSSMVNAISSMIGLDTSKSTVVQAAKSKGA